MRVGVTRAFFVTENAREVEQALERRLANRLRQLKLATTPDGRVLGGDRAVLECFTLLGALAACTTTIGIGALVLVSVVASLVSLFFAPAYIGLLGLLHRDLRHLAEALIGHVGLNPGSHYPAMLLRDADMLGQTNLQALLLAVVLGVAQALDQLVFGIDFQNRLRLRRLRRRRELLPRPDRQLLHHQ